MRDGKTDPEAKITFVWVVDGEENLNVELIRQGCFHFLTQAVSEQCLQVPKDDYNAFMKKLLSAAEYASENKLGVFSNNP